LSFAAIVDTEGAFAPLTPVIAPEELTTRGTRQ
jgi:hypothetical protein